VVHIHLHLFSFIPFVYSSLRALNRLLVFLPCGDVLLHRTTATLMGYSMPSCPLSHHPDATQAALQQGRNLSVDAMTALACIYQLSY
jgi:hypothetical protein